MWFTVRALSVGKKASIRSVVSGFSKRYRQATQHRQHPMNLFPRKKTAVGFKCMEDGFIDKSKPQDMKT